MHNKRILRTPKDVTEWFSRTPTAPVTCERWGGQRLEARTFDEAMRFLKPLKLLTLPTGNRTAFSFTVEDDVLVLIDETEDKPLTSLTNAIGFVLVYFKREFGSAMPSQVVSRDSDGYWCRVIHTNGKFESWRPIANGLTAHGWEPEDVLELLSQKCMLQ
ncbi:MULTISPECIES: hypothetical protein [Vibrio]|uniref:hypothetical protein n=1 Tax=Vibrio TaxID=662 RepID=UPI000841A824|nr:MULTISPECIES: hypothetical protein [Vibrio]ODM56030.1 hypothetical protein BC455_22800 [Vibrio harveyi]USD58588.1 hypothetical protein J4N44_26925 [Vibrio sp. SCSIO 43155]